MPPTAPAECLPPPHNPEAERAVLGAVLLAPEALAQVRDLLSPRDFYTTAHSLILRAVLAVADRGEPVDDLTVCAELRRTRSLEKAGGAAGVSALSGCGLPGLEHASHYAGMVRDLAARRRALGAALTAAQRLREDDGADPVALLSPVQEALAACGRINGSRALGIAACDLLALNLPAPCYVVKDIVPEGLSLLVGPPKFGKSWLALSIGVSVAAGGPALGSIPTRQGPVLVLALEDSRRRVQTRLRMILDGEPAPDDLHIVTLEDTWRRPLPEGLADLAAYVREKSPRLNVLDTLGRLRRAGSGKKNAYHVDVDELGPLQGLAQGTPGLALVALHHDTKAKSGDFVDAVSGSRGVSGTADSVLTLARTRGQGDAELRVTGRDIGEAELALRFDPTRGVWTVLGSAQEYRQTEERREVLDALRQVPEGLSPQDLADAVGKTWRHLRKLVYKLVKGGFITKTGARGGTRYTLPKGRDTGDSRDTSERERESKCPWCPW